MRIRRELLNSGHTVSATTIGALLRRHGVPPAPRRAGLSWRAFLRAHAEGVLACDFFRVEALRLQTLFVLFFIELQTRRVFIVGCTEHPSAAWVTQQARNLAWYLDEAERWPTLLVRRQSRQRYRWSAGAGRPSLMTAGLWQGGQDGVVIPSRRERGPGRPAYESQTS
jgi:hypothetical protein